MPVSDPKTPSAKLLLGRTLGFLDDPAAAGAAASHRFEEHGAIVVGVDGRIAWAGDPPERLPGLQIRALKFQSSSSKFPRARTCEFVRARSRLYKFRRASASARLWWNLSSQ